MSVLIDDVAVRVAALSAVSTPGYAVDKGILKDDTHERVCLTDFPGQPSETGFGVDGVQYEHPGLQVMVRGNPTEWVEPEAVARAIYLDLVKVQASTALTSGTLYLMFRALSPPTFYRRDEKDRNLFVVNFIVDKAP